MSVDHGVLGGAPAVLAEVGIDEDVVVVVSVVVVPVVASVVLELVDSVVDSLSCAQAASVSDVTTMAAAVRVRSVVFMESSVCLCAWVLHASGRPEGRPDIPCCN
jgi:hypothetical protein